MSSANPPQSVIELTFGPLVSGIWIQQLLLGFILAQMVDYYRVHYKKDSLFNKITVSLLLVLNLFIGGTDFHVLYRSSVVHYGVYEFFDLQTWTMWTEPGFTAVIGFIAQIFFLARYRKMTQRNNIISVLLALLVLFSLGAGLAVSGSFIEDKKFSSLGEFTLPIILWLVSTSLADVSIASMLIYTLLQSRTGFHKTNSVITRIMIMSMETSAMTAIVAVLNLVLFLPLQNTAYHLLPQFSMSRVYTITVMVTLLARPSLRGALLSTDHVSLGTSLQGGEETTNRDMTTGKGPIRVGVSTTVQHDSESNDTNIELDDRKVLGWAA
ncbi:hypothetical protein C8J56DRAFT_943389 [Mycena floridula]|nr:hypothetical protein C8J56DRAFT_943389 [Mycena floridula]